MEIVCVTRICEQPAAVTNLNPAGTSAYTTHPFN